MTKDALPQAAQSATGEWTDGDEPPLTGFWQPRYWPMWLGFGLLRLLIMLPFRVQVGIGKLLGRLIFGLMPKRRRIARANIDICFPDLSAAARARMLREHLESTGFTIFEIGLALWADDETISRLVTVKGYEHPKALLDQGQGFVALGGHFPGVELVGRALQLQKQFPPSGAMYRNVKNPLANALLRRARRKSIACLIPKEDLRKMIRLLKRGIPVWYACDQSYDGPKSALVPFFGEPAMTNIALGQIARMGNARVVQMLQRRLPDYSGYEIIFLPPLEDFPGQDPVADIERINHVLEDWIRKAPEQYYWVHRRFKNRPAPFADPYRQT